MDLSIITVTYNSAQTILEQMRSVRSACQGMAWEQIIVDNGSTDGTVEQIKKEFPLVRVIENKENLGFAIANNKGTEISSGEFLLFLNPDMTFPDGEKLTRWIEWMKQHPNVGISGCKLVKQDGTLNLDAMPRRFPRVWEVIAILLKIPHLFPNLLNGYLYRDRDFTKEQEVDSVRGSCMFMRREFIEKRGYAFDPRYFIWFEDVDACRDAIKLGYKVWYTPIISCIDLVGQSFKKKKFLQKQWWFVHSSLRYFWKWL